jgi:hypothetical protein
MKLVTAPVYLGERPSPGAAMIAVPRYVNIPATGTCIPCCARALCAEKAGQ